MTKFFDNTEFVSQMGNSQKTSNSITGILLAFGIGIAVGFLLKSVHIKSKENITIKKWYDRDQNTDRELA
jgi:hypothetical protein